VGVGGEIGIVSGGVESAIEYIWKNRKASQKVATQKSEVSEQNEVEILIGSRVPTTESLYRQLQNGVLSSLYDLDLKNRQRRKILRWLKRDARRLGPVLTQALALPNIHGWEIDGFFKNYYFSAGGDLLEVLSAEVDRRIRFRFKISPSADAVTSPARWTSAQSLYVRILQSLAQASSLENPWELFRLERAWYLLERSKELDLGFFSTGVGRGLLVQFRKTRPSTLASVSPGKSLVHMGQLQSLAKDWVRGVQNSSQYERTMFLDQIRLKLSLEGDFNVSLATFSKASTLELHYFRQEKP
jgi:hypothetical protein